MAMAQRGQEEVAESEESFGPMPISKLEVYEFDDALLY